MKSIAVFAVMCMALAGLVSAQDVQFNFDPSADFSKYKTYRWAKHPQSADVDDLTLRQMAAATEAELAKKGLTASNTDQSDLVIVYQFASHKEQEITTWDTGYGYGPGWRGGWYGGGSGMSTSTTNTLTVGSVALDMYDASTKKLVWRGVASKTLDPGAKPEKRQKNMQKAAAKLLKNYPPKQKT